MKICDIISEEVDVSFWKRLDSQFNPEAFDYVEKQEKRQEIVNSTLDGTKVFTKPVRKSQKPFTNNPQNDQPSSPGYKGNVNARLKSGHINRKKAKKLLDK